MVRILAMAVLMLGAVFVYGKETTIPEEIITEINEACEMLTTHQEKVSGALGKVEEVSKAKAEELTELDAEIVVNLRQEMAEESELRALQTTTDKFRRLIQLKDGAIRYWKTKARK